MDIHLKTLAQTEAHSGETRRPMRSRTKGILVRFTSAERERFNTLLSRSPLGQEEFARRRLLGHRLPSPTNHVAIHRLSVLAQRLPDNLRQEVAAIMELLA